MDIFKLMESRQSQYTASQRKVYQLILKDPSVIERYTITKVASLAHTSTSAVLRFSQTLGFDGYKDFRYALIHAAQETASSHENTLTELFTDALSKLKKDEQLDQVAASMKSCRLLFILGYHYSSLPAAYLKMKLEDIGIPAHLLCDTIGAAHTLNTAGEKDGIIVFTVSGDVGYDRSLYDLLQSVPAQKLALITCTKNNRYKSLFAQTVVLPGIASSAYPRADAHPVMMVYADLLIHALSTPKESSS